MLSLFLPCSGASVSVTGRDVEGLLSAWLSRAKQASRPKLRALHDAHLALQLAAATSAKGGFTPYRGIGPLSGLLYFQGQKGPMSL